MNSHASKTLIQIHYHNHTCGVTKVMERYAGAFNRISPSRSKRNIIICYNVHTGQLDLKDIETISIKDCNYHTFRTRKAFSTVKERLLRKLENIISSQQLPHPVCVVGHNLSLGKNVALSAAFEQLVNQYYLRNDVRFYSVIHDMAEEGRTRLMCRIRYMKSLGIPVWKYLYPQNNIEYVVLNKRNYTLFNHAGFSVSLLPNPIDNVKCPARFSKKEHQSIDSALLQLAQNDRTRFDKSAPTFFYPVRVVSRKNVLEAIMVTRLIHRANLLVGRSGTSRHDQKLFTEIKRISQKYNLPVVLDVERLHRYLPKRLLEKGTVFSLLYNYSDVCISTSIGEGFGYALYEPWLYGKKVTGRLPRGIAPVELIDLSHLYTRFDIPISWIPIDKIQKCYYDRIVQTFGTQSKLSQENFNKNFLKSFLQNRCIDFGALSQGMQFNLFRKLCLYSSSLTRQLSYLKDAETVFKKYSHLPERVSRYRIRQNGKVLNDTLGGKAFDRRFKECFYKASSHAKKRKCDRRFFIRYFSSLDEFRLLMTPGL